MKATNTANGSGNQQNGRHLLRSFDLTPTKAIEPPRPILAPTGGKLDKSQPAQGLRFFNAIGKPFRVSIYIWSYTQHDAKWLSVALVVVADFRVDISR